jgi:enoyl-CoA hydratase/carnithine racemase
MSLVLVDDHDRVRVLTLSRPGARNAMSTALLGELLDALAAANTASHLRALVLAGAGGSFSAGADLREQLDHAGQVRRMDLFCQVYEAVTTSPLPTVAAISGHCVGGGVEVAAACDLRVADPTASFRFPGAALGIPVGAAKLVGLIGLGTAKDLVLTSRTFDAEEAVRIGFAQRLAPDGEAVATALAVAAQIAAHHPQAVAYLRRQFERFSGAADRVAVENDSLHALAEAGGDYAALTRDPRGVGSTASGA